MATTRAAPARIGGFERTTRPIHRPRSLLASLVTGLVGGALVALALRHYAELAELRDILHAHHAPTTSALPFLLPGLEALFGAALLAACAIGAWRAIRRRE